MILFSKLKSRYFPGEIPPRMSAPEQSCYLSVLNASRSVIEYGAGGSTMLAVRSQASKIVCVDSDVNWILRLREHPKIRDAEAEGRIEFIHADIGPVSDWGVPIDPAMLHRYPDYCIAPWNGDANPDLVLVDGRFRVACIMQSLLRSTEKMRIVAHDFWNRENYHAVLPFVDVIDTAGTLGVFKRKQVFDDGAAKEVLKKYEMNYD